VQDLFFNSSADSLFARTTDVNLSGLHRSVPTLPGRGASLQKKQIGRETNFLQSICYARREKKDLQMLPHFSIILLCLVCQLAVVAETSPAEPTTRPGIRLARIQSERIRESSGVVASRKYPGVFWTLNDSGNPPTIFAINDEGKVLGEFRVKRGNRDWEDLSIDDAGHLYIAEIGNNGGRFRETAVYRLDEPDPFKKPDNARPLEITHEWRLRFPDQPFDAESLFIRETTGYVISKYLNASQAEIYTFDLASSEKFQTLKKVATLPIRAPVTGAALSADNARMALVTGLGIQLFHIDGNIEGAGSLQPAFVPFLNPSMEAVCFAGDFVVTTCEDKTMAFFARNLFDTPKK